MRTNQLLLHSKSFLFLIFCCLTLSTIGEAQILEKLKDAMGGKTSQTPQENTAKTKTPPRNGPFILPML